MQISEVRTYVVGVPPPHHGGRYWVFRDGLYGREEDAEGCADARAPGWFVHGVFA